MLREDNADMRLTETGRHLGLVDDRRWQSFVAKRDALDELRRRLCRQQLTPADLNSDTQENILGQLLTRDTSIYDLLRRPQVHCRQLMTAVGIDSNAVSDEQLDLLSPEARYAGYIERQRIEIERLRRNEETPLPAELDYRQVRGLSAEVQQKLNDYKPATVGQAARISGITPAAVSLLLVHLKRRAA